MRSIKLRSVLAATAAVIVMLGAVRYSVLIPAFSRASAETLHQVLAGAEGAAADAEEAGKRLSDAMSLALEEGGKKFSDSMSRALKIAPAKPAVATETPAHTGAPAQPGGTAPVETAENIPGNTFVYVPGGPWIGGGGGGGGGGGHDVPETSSLMLLGGGLLVLTFFGFARRRERAA